MKAAYEHIELDNQQSSFTAYPRATDYFDFNWHYHSEIELTLIKKGNGTRLVGDHTESFSDYDFVMLGQNLPHTWVSESKEAGQEAIVIQFRSTLIPAVQLELPEFSNIKRLLQHAHLGIAFNKQTAQYFESLLSNLLGKTALDKLTELWRILDLLGQAKNTRHLASPIYRPALGTRTEHRIDQACQHIHKNFTRKISLTEMGKIVGMTETSFCRFFKKMTGKSFTDYVNDLKVSRAKKLLIESEGNISAIAYASGFDSMTHFNRIFLKKNGIPPRAYRKKVKRLG
ncbi:MAG: AraC family transcriptional regulator [Bacteroidota bacterium]